MRFISATTICRRRSILKFSHARQKRSNSNLFRYGVWQVTGFAQRRKAIRLSASPRTQTSHSSIAIAVRGHAGDGGAFARRQHRRHRRKTNSSPAIACRELRTRRAGVRLCNLAAQGAHTAQGSVQAMETAALMLGTDKSRGYCMKMICADFLAGAHLDDGNPEILLNSISRYYKFLPGEQQQAFLVNLLEKAS